MKFLIQLGVVGVALIGGIVAFVFLKKPKRKQSEEDPEKSSVNLTERIPPNPALAAAAERQKQRKDSDASSSSTSKSSKSSRKSSSSSSSSSDSESIASSGTQS